MNDQVARDQALEEAAHKTEDEWSCIDWSAESERDPEDVERRVRDLAAAAIRALKNQPPTTQGTSTENCS